MPDEKVRINNLIYKINPKRNKRKNKCERTMLIISIFKEYN